MSSLVSHNLYVGLWMFLLYITIHHKVEVDTPYSPTAPVVAPLDAALAGGSPSPARRRE